ncbi:hypothetical protein D3C84_956380 [compost metagenome]
MLPHMKRQPSAAHRPEHSRQPARYDRRICPQIARMVNAEAACTIRFTCRLAAVLSQLIDVVEQRLMAFRQIRRLRRPIIHLNINVRMEVRLPRRSHRFVPDPLQIRRQAARARA